MEKEGEVYVMTLATVHRLLSDPEAGVREVEAALKFMKQYNIEGNKSTKPQENNIVHLVEKVQEEMELPFPAKEA